eukprot:4075782-Amphidinium_carterae.1
MHVDYTVYSAGAPQSNSDEALAHLLDQEMQAVRSSSEAIELQLSARELMLGSHKKCSTLSLSSWTASQSEGVMNRQSRHAFPSHVSIGIQTGMGPGCYEGTQEASTQTIGHRPPKAPVIAGAASS